MNSNQSTSSSRPSAEAISRRAYELWEQEGRPENCDLRHWLQAEQELNGTSSTSRSSSATPSAASTRDTQAAARTDTRPPQGTRASPPRDSRRTTTTPFERTAGAGAVETAGAKRR